MNSFIFTLALVAVRTEGGSIRSSTVATLTPWSDLFSWEVALDFNPQDGSIGPVGSISYPSWMVPGIAYGDVGCRAQWGNVDGPNWKQWTVADENSVSITSGGNMLCRTINTANACKFEVGDNGVTGVAFDYSISPQCYDTSQPGGTAGVTSWLSFWIYSADVPGKYWEASSEVDFIETKWGPGQGLNLNFAGLGTQKTVKNIMSGSVSTTFKGTGTNGVQVATTADSGAGVATNTLHLSTGYFFVLDIADNKVQDNAPAGCTVKISNLKISGKVPNGQCSGLL